jgi:DNA-binding PadR family transcriptional regulator
MFGERWRNKNKQNPPAGAGQAPGDPGYPPPHHQQGGPGGSASAPPPQQQQQGQQPQQGQRRVDPNAFPPAFPSPQDPDKTKDNLPIVNDNSDATRAGGAVGEDGEEIWNFISEPDPAAPAKKPEERRAPPRPDSVAMPAANQPRLDKFTPDAAAGAENMAPPMPDNLFATGLPEHFVKDLVLKVFYFDGRMRGVDLAHVVRLNYNAIEPALDFLKEQQLISVVGGGAAFGKQSMEYAITDKGIVKTKEVLLRDNYYGPAPVPVSAYVRRVALQSIERYHISPDRVEKAFSKLVLDPKVPELMGPAINSGRSMFLYGPPGNGKTALAECITESVGGEVFIPYAIYVDRQIIKVFDPLYHELIPVTPQEEQSMDQRWLKCRRPIVMVGGELTLETLDLASHGDATYYEAPFQLKATNGVLFIDDFGRQRANPDELLNRWIVPLESRFDFLTFASGLKVRVPFDCLLVFSTNLDPKDLVDDAFLRRIRYKISINNPSEENYRKIFEIFAKIKKVNYEQDTLEYLIQKHYKVANRPFRACHPRDLMEQYIDIQKYKGEPQAELTPDILDRLCDFYFVEIMD